MTRKTSQKIMIAMTVVVLTTFIVLLIFTNGNPHIGKYIERDSISNPDIVKMSAMKSEYEQQRKEIDYYMRSHSLLDEGFDIVTRRREHLSKQIDSIASLIDATERFEAIVPFFVLTQSEYIYPKHLFFNDTICTRQDGVAYIQYPDHSYYEGQYVDTLYENATTSKLVREGFGVAFDKKRVRAGIWRNDIYQGEQPLYTSNHIYGIDISRYQHEQPGQKMKKTSWKTVSTQVKVKGKIRTIKKKVKVSEPVSYPIDWNRLRITSLGTKSKKKIDGVVDYPISFVYIKSTEGVSITNKYYLGDYVQSRKHGYKTGTYHFFSIKSAAASQAMFFIRNSRYQKGDLPPVLDVEPTPAQVAQMGGAKVMLKSVRQWMEYVERYLGVKPLLYISQNFVNRYLNDNYSDGVYLKENYHVWIARYGEYKPDVHLIYWQLCPDGRVAGIRFPVDINIFNGYADAFNEFIK